MTTLIVSDLHLAPERPQIVEQFVEFLRGRASAAQRLFILGDLFEAWVGDDALAEPFNARIAAELSALAGSGVAVAFQHGNRDFLIGDAFARAAGVRLLAEEVVVDLEGEPTLLMHGDLLCTDDVDYQAMRERFRSAAWRAAMLARPLAERLALAREYRQQSEDATARKPEAITDVNDDAVAVALRRNRCRRLVHGHTHRPGRHRHRVDDIECERLVLADWYARGSCLVAREGRIEPDRI